VISGYDLSNTNLQWKPIRINSTVVGGFKVHFVEAQTMDDVFLLRFVVAEKPVFVNGIRITPDKVKIDIAIRYHNPLHVPAAWTTGPSNSTLFPNAKVGYLAITFSQFAAAGFRNGSATGNVAGELTVAAGGFMGNFSWAPTAQFTVNGNVNNGAVYASATDNTAKVQGAAIAGYSFKLIFFSFEAFRPSLVFWDPTFGADINYDTVDAQVPADTTAPMNGSASALFCSLILCIASVLIF